MNKKIRMICFYVNNLNYLLGFWLFVFLGFGVIIANKIDNSFIFVGFVF